MADRIKNTSEPIIKTNEVGKTVPIFVVTKIVVHSVNTPAAISGAATTPKDWAAVSG